MFATNVIYKEFNIFGFLIFKEINTNHSYLEIAKENIVAQCVVISILNNVTQTNNDGDKCWYCLNFPGFCQNYVRNYKAKQKLKKNK